METYKQGIKEDSRELLWEHSIYSLTTQRSNNRVLKEEYIRNLWNYIFYKGEFTKDFFVDKKPDIGYLNSWCDFANNIYGFKKSNELKIVYLCGPEPENDLKILLKLGVRIENIWAIESDKKIYKCAINNIRNKYPRLKIFNGKINDFFEMYPLEFDIIYLDFTAPILSKKESPFKTVHKIFDNHSLAEMGILITNYSIPDKSEEYVEFLADFFLYQKYLEGNIHGDLDDKNQQITWFSDGAEACYGSDVGQLRLKIDENFENAYSSFCSLYPIFYANVVLPAYRVMKEKSLYNKIFNMDTKLVDKHLKESYNEELQYLFRDCPEVGFISRLLKSNSSLSKYWSNVYLEKESGSSWNRYESIEAFAILRSALEFNYGDREVLSDDFINSMLDSYNKMEKYEEKRLFCDIIFKDVLSQIAFNQLGFPYHAQMFNHKRFSYKAKERKMFVDIITFDRCRAFYDWLPMMDFYNSELESMERQMILRSCVDIIGGKQYGSTPIPILSSGVNLIGMGEAKWFEFCNSLPKRIFLK